MTTTLPRRPYDQAKHLSINTPLLAALLANLAMWVLIIALVRWLAG